MSCLRQKYYSNLYGKILHVPELKGILYKKKKKKEKGVKTAALSLPLEVNDNMARFHVCVSRTND